MAATTQLCLRLTAALARVEALTDALQAWTHWDGLAAAEFADRVTAEQLEELRERARILTREATARQGRPRKEAT